MPSTNSQDTRERDPEALPSGVVAVVSPTYNEADNLPELAQRLFALDIPNLRLYIVDDGSPDGTAEVARQLSEKRGGGIEVISRAGKQGLGTAYVAGFSKALNDGCDYIVQMDADLSHEPETAPDMLRKLANADVVVGSRYTERGGVDPEWSLKRRFISAFGNHTIRLVTGLKPKDVTSGFKAYRADALRALDMSGFRCRGFGFQSEVAYHCQARGYRVVEQPIIFMERAKGESKMSARIVVEAVWKLTLLRFRKV